LQDACVSLAKNAAAVGSGSLIGPDCQSPEPNFAAWDGCRVIMKVASHAFYDSTSLIKANRSVRPIAPLKSLFGLCNSVEAPENGA